MTPRPLKILTASSWVVVLLCLVVLLFLAVAGPNVISGQMISDCAKDVQEIRASTDFRWVQQIATFRTQLLAYTMDGFRGLLIVAASVILLCGFSAGISLWQLRRLKRELHESKDAALPVSGANRRWCWQFRCRGPRHEYDVAQLSTFAVNLMNPIDQAISDKVIARKHELMKLSPAQLRHLPFYNAEEFSACGKTQNLGVYHDKTGKGEDIVVTQCKRHILLGYGHMFAEGFVLDSSDKIRDAEKELMWDYT